MTTHENGNNTLRLAAADDRRAGVRNLFQSLHPGTDGQLPHGALLAALHRAGIERDDPRIKATVAALDQRDASEGLSVEEFEVVVRPSRIVIDRVLGGRVVIPDFEAFVDKTERIFDSKADLTGGAVADYIPQLGAVDPEQYGLSVCTVDGQRLSLGDATTDFSLQSCCKPINYCLALEEHGIDLVHRHIGREPSGVSFNELALNREGRPHNPMINAGAIMSCALVKPGETSADRFDHVVRAWKHLTGGRKPGFSNSTYLSERQTADRNFALAYSMRESGAFPEGSDLLDTLEFYIQCCSMETTAEALSLAAATLANGGVCPTTGERVLKPDTVQKCLSLMDSCGMYDFSGEWAFTVGLPAKSGVSGAIWVVVPNVLGLCVWSPRLDACGNSVRGVAFCEQLVETFNFHKHDNLVGHADDKTDPRRTPGARRADDVGTLCWAASEGDLVTLRQLIARGVAPGAADYDGRTALHLAAAEGRRDVVQYLLDIGVGPNARDRWQGTAMDDATRGGHAAVIEVLEQRGGRHGLAEAKAG